MAAFCGCCGAEIGPKAEACTVCGMPRHGMMPAEQEPALDLGADTARENAILGGPDAGSCGWQ